MKASIKLKTHDIMNTLAFFSFLLIVLDFIYAATAFSAFTASFDCRSICQQFSSRLHYNVPRKRPVNTEVKNLSVDSISVIAAPLDFILSEIASTDVSGTQAINTHFMPNLSHPTPLACDILLPQTRSLFSRQLIALTA